MVVEKKYGSWSSPILPTHIQSNAVTYSYVCQDQNNENTDLIVYWVELRSNDNGRNIIVSRNLNCKDNIIWTPKEFSARTRVHEYGGADCFVYSGIVYFSNNSDQQLYKQSEPQAPPIRVSREDNCRYANGFYSGDMETIFIVREDHRDEKNVINSIVTVHNNVERIVVEGADFYSSPRVSNDGKKLCWVEWMHPNMPWDNTLIRVASIDPCHRTLVPGSILTVVTGTNDTPISSSLPQWTVSGDLSFICDQTGYWNLWIKTMDTSDKIVNLSGADEDLADPMWRFDTRRHNYLSRTNQFVVARKDGKLEFLKPDGSDRRLVDYGRHISSILFCQLMWDGTVVALAYNSTTKKTIYRFWPDGNVEVLGQNPLCDGIDVRYLSIPRHIRFPVADTFSYGYYYAPCNPEYCPPKGSLPPLLVQAHGGPTAATNIELKMSIQYWTSRGYAVLDVDYRGSTGYGKAYRELLKGKWGILDQEDCAAGAEYLSGQGMIDGDKVVIRGGSAGGYTALCCLTFTSVFKAGSSCYGIGDLKKLLEDTHKFESRYMDIIVGDIVDQGHRYIERSPINYPERISCPVIFFQGDEDRVVPKEQSETMFNTVKKRGVPCSFVLYPGEAHGFRKIENIIHNIESEYYFFAKLFGFDTPDIDNPSIVIENFSQ